MFPSVVEAVLSTTRWVEKPGTKYSKKKKISQTRIRYLEVKKKETTVPTAARPYTRREQVNKQTVVCRECEIWQLVVRFYLLLFYCLEHKFVPLFLKRGVTTSSIFGAGKGLMCRQYLSSLLRVEDVQFLILK